jgi:hypothetical protein
VPVPGGCFERDNVVDGLLVLSGAVGPGFALRGVVGVARHPGSVASVLAAISCFVLGSRLGFLRLTSRWS